MSFDLLELLEQERVLARRLGLNKPDVLVQSVRCRRCGHVSSHRQARAPALVSEVDEMAELIEERLDRSPVERCPACRSSSLDARSGTHAFLGYSGASRGHLIVLVEVGPTPSGEGQMLTQRLLFAPDEGGLRELDPGEEPCLVYFAESSLRAALAQGSLEALQESLLEVQGHAELRRLARREIARAYLERGHEEAALQELESLLSESPKQPDVLVLAARLHALLGHPGRASELCAQALEQGTDEELLPLLLAVASQARRLGLVRQVALQLLEEDPQHLSALKALVSVESATRLTVFRRCWEALHEAALASGDAVTARAASDWLRGLSLPLPDWPEEADAATFLALLARTLETTDCSLDTSVQELPLELGSVPIAGILTSPDGLRRAVLINEALPRAHVAATLVATLRAVTANPNLADAPLLLSRQPLPWWLLRYASSATDAAVDLAADADTTLQVHEENIAGALWLAERYFGALLDFSIESLAEIDRILIRYHEEGLGTMTFPMIAMMASYVGEVITRSIPGTRWEPGTGASDPRVLVFPAGGSLDLITRLRRFLLVGGESGMHALVLGLLDTLIGEAQGEA